MTDDCVSLVAARDHTATSRQLPVRAHVIVTHDLHARVGQVIDLFSAASRVDKVLLEEVTRSLLDGIEADADLLISELMSIKRWASRQRKRLPTSIKQDAAE